MADSKRIQFDLQGHMICAVLHHPSSLSRQREALTLVAIVVGILAALLMVVPPAEAATINVTPGAVDVVNNGNCSIREAIQAANTDAAVDACAAGSGADTINAPGTYVLTAADNDANGLPVIESTITINYANISRALGAPAFRIFEVASTGNLSLNAVTVSGGLAADCPFGVGDVCGGGVANNGTLTVRNSRITNNAATSSDTDVWGGGLANYGTLNVSSSRIDGNSVSCTETACFALGGGISNNTGTLDVRSSRIEGNSSSCPETFCITRGGGIYNGSDTLDVRSSVIVNNTSSCSGGFCEADGAGIGNDAATNITGSQVSGNTTSCSAGGCTSFGGGIASFATLNVTSSQVVSNTASCSTNGCLALGGGIGNLGTLSVNGSGVATNTVSAPLGTARGGGLYNQVGTSTLTNSSVTSNTASGATAEGGGIYNNAGSVILNTTFVSGNTPDNCEPAIGSCN